MNDRYCEDCNRYKNCNKTVTQSATTCMFYNSVATSADRTKDMRKFGSGATRNNVEGRLNYVKALSPIVLERYVQYLNAHRKQADGTLRDFDNWKKGIPTNVYFEGLGRHFIALWLLTDGYPAEDNKGPVNMEDTLAAIIFNSMGWLHEILKEKLEAAQKCGKS